MERIELDWSLLKNCGCAVIDPMQVDEALWEQRPGEVLWNGLPVRSLAPDNRSHERLVRYFPCVLNLDALDIDTRSALYDDIVKRHEAGAPPQFCLLVESRYKPSWVADYLEFRTVFDRVRESKKYQVRYHDAYTLMQLWRILEPDQRERLLGPAHMWLFALEGQWWRLRAPGVENSPGLRLKDDQWEQLRRVGTVNTMLARQGAAPEQFATLGGQYDAWLETARTVGLTDEEDMIAFAMQGLTRHPKFYRHSVIADILAQCRGQPGHYSNLSAVLSEDQWQRIVAYMNSL